MCGCCGCGGRKKREATTVLTSRHNESCNSNELRQIMKKAIKVDPHLSLITIIELLKDGYGYVTVCDDKKISIAAQTDEYCIMKKNGIHCGVFRLKQNETDHSDGSADESGRIGIENDSVEEISKETTEILVKKAD
ncbi:unnamed protein product [Haemonchus placei]|uniref:Ground-like domain-containing protein n=1 Tax=Haemonchus placei TaxID=6290 RepID=A0A0N4WQ81_HAEPC|nr:unnamed protein product [Haemonchus placei]